MRLPRSISFAGWTRVHLVDVPRELQVVKTMSAGDSKLAVVPSALGYGSEGINLPQVRSGLCHADMPYAICL